MPKYSNRRTNGYASRKEARRGAELFMLQTAGIIRNLEEQVKYELIPKQEGERAVTYTADFRYIDDKGKTVVEDAKGVKTQQYVIRRKLMLWRYGIRIMEV